MKNILYLLLIGLWFSTTNTNTATAQQQETFQHIVKKGETLYNLSNKYDLTIDQIFEYNNYLRFDILELGDTLVLPKTKRTQAPITPKPAIKKPQATTTPTVKKEESITHIVDEKETLYSLSRRYDVPVKTILAYNPFIDENVIKITDTLLIPLNIVIEQAAKNNRNSNKNKEDKTIEGNLSHIVSDQETLYGISKRYEVPIEKLLEMNPNLNVGVIGIGDTILLDMDSQALSILKTADNEKRDENPNNDNKSPFDKEDIDTLTTVIDTITKITHTVNQNETLYSIAKKYESDIADLVRWNDLKQDELTKGQELIVKYFNPQEFKEEESKYVTKHEVDYSKMKPIKHTINQGETLTSLSTQYNQRIGILKEWNNIENDEDPLPQEVTVGWYIPNPTSVKPIVSIGEQEQEFRGRYMNRNADQLQFQVVYGKGKGTWLKDNTAFDKNFYALHKTAPIKSYIRVVNPMNKKTVYVKVIGKLPNTGANEDVELKITYAAVQKLNLRDGKFLLEWSYHTPK